MQPAGNVRQAVKVALSMSLLTRQFNNQINIVQTLEQPWNLLKLMHLNSQVGITYWLIGILNMTVSLLHRKWTNQFEKLPYIRRWSCHDSPKIKPVKHCKQMKIICRPQLCNQRFGASVCTDGERFNVIKNGLLPGITDYWWNNWYEMSEFRERRNDEISVIKPDDDPAPFSRHDNNVAWQPPLYAVQADRQQRSKPVPETLMSPAVAGGNGYRFQTSISSCGYRWIECQRRERNNRRLRPSVHNSWNGLHNPAKWAYSFYAR
jgi:hypothetical protein